MSLLHVLILAIVQGLAELLPVSSSAHVIVAEKLMGMDPSAPETTLLLVMLHTGTMFAVIAYFWGRWRKAFFQGAAEFKSFVIALILATILTGIVGGILTEAIEKLAFRNAPHAWVEQLFGRLDLIAGALAAAGILILVAGLAERRAHQGGRVEIASDLTAAQASWIGIVQGFCLPFRGFSRSGATISTGMLAGVAKVRAEDFSFALAVVLTPVAIAREMLRMAKTEHLHSIASLMPATVPSMVGMVFAFLAGLLALKWLSRWLETGRWYWFGIYCLVAALVVGLLYRSGY
ncbi:MAG TPA: undecaprenyl-diphosphate phosphatase [Candidatus Acidoferrum sp.]|nr:undecaprenyl-diphosphate phosphatase [Candidatus Acidoferrum sp.]